MFSPLTTAILVADRRRTLEAAANHHRAVRLARQARPSFLRRRAAGGPATPAPGLVDPDRRRGPGLGGLTPA